MILLARYGERAAVVAQSAIKVKVKRFGIEDGGNSEKAGSP
jgi:hypothetical protein